MAENFLQQKDIDFVRNMESKTIPIRFPYEEIRGLSTEARQKLMTMKPETVAQASRISGVRASDLSILVVHLARYRDSTDDGRPERQHVGECSR